MHDFEHADQTWRHRVGAIDAGPTLFPQISTFRYPQRYDDDPTELFWHRRTFRAGARSEERSLSATHGRRYSVVLVGVIDRRGFGTPGRPTAMLRLVRIPRPDGWLRRMKTASQRYSSGDAAIPVDIWHLARTAIGVPVSASFTPNRCRAR